MPIVALFYRANGMDHLDIYLLQAIYSLSIAVMEIPSGYMADVVGRKKTLIVGSFLGALGYVLYSVSSGFHSFLIAEIILGLSGSFISGADSAMLYDSLAADHKHHQYLQFEGRITSLGNFGETAAALCGGLAAAALSYRTVYGMQALIATIAIPASLMLIEPPRDSMQHRPGLRHILEICRMALLRNKPLSSAIVLSSFSGIATLGMAWSVQIYFVDNGLDELTITPLWIVLNLIVAFGAAYALRIRNLLGEWPALSLIILVLPSTFIVLGTMPFVFALGVLVVFHTIRGYATPMLKDLINLHCSSPIRATVLSIRSLIIRLGFALFGPLIGIISGQYSLDSALLIGGSVLTVFTFLAGLRLYHHIPAPYSS